MQITDAMKQTDGKNTFVVYVIRVDYRETRHRYSEFESLRSSLALLYPTLIIPPIPEKQTLTEIAIKETQPIINRRKRLLGIFLDRILKHPTLRHEEVFLKFLEPGISWVGHNPVNSIAVADVNKTEQLHLPPLSLLPKNILRAPSNAPADSSFANLYQALPIPSSSQPLRRPDQRFLDSEAFTGKFAAHVSGSMSRVDRKLLKLWAECATENSNLGAALNGFSLSESGDLALAIEKTGQAFDVSFMSITSMIQEWEKTWSTHLHEYSQFSSIIKRLLGYRHAKHVQFELGQETLQTKRIVLADLERSEADARRLDVALTTGVLTPAQAETAAASSDESPVSIPAGLSIPSEVQGRLLSNPSSNNFWGALSHSVRGMIDMDPDLTRRTTIEKTREDINVLEEALTLSAADVKFASLAIQSDLDRFQRQKVSDFRTTCIQMADLHKQMCEKNLQAWKEALIQIEELEDDDASIPPKI